MTGTGKTIFNMSMSLDGYVAGPNDGPKNGLGDNGAALFAWYNNGDVLYVTPGGNMSFKLTKKSASILEERFKSIGVIITGRKTFNITNGWNGQHPVDVPVIVLTHNIPKGWNEKYPHFIFITDGIEHAITEAKKIAGNKDVGIGTASTFQQCIKVCLLDEIHIDLAPIILAGGVNLFKIIKDNSIKLDQLEAIEGKEVVHLTYRVRYNSF